MITKTTANAEQQIRYYGLEPLPWWGLLPFARECASPNPVTLIRLHSVSEALLFDGATVTQFAGHLDRVLPCVFVRVVLGEENIRAVHAGHTPLFVYRFL